MAAIAALTRIRRHIHYQAINCKHSIPNVSLSPKLRYVASRATRGPFILCVLLYLLSVSVLSLRSWIQFVSALHANSFTPDYLPADLNIGHRNLASSPGSIQWAPPSPTTTSGSLRNDSEEIPRFIHRMWRDLASDTPEEWTNATHSCQEQNPSYEQYIWTDATAHQFMRTHFAWFLQTYTEHLLPLQRVDALRYFLLWHYGGIYLDPEVGCQRPLEPLWNETSALLPQAWPYGVSQKLVASKPSHPFVMKVALVIHEYHRSVLPDAVLAMLNTGSIHVSRVLGTWFGSMRGSPGISILPSDGFVGKEDSFFMLYARSVPLGDQFTISEHVLENWIGWCGVLVSFSVMAFVILGVQTSPKGGRDQSRTVLTV